MDRYNDSEFQMSDFRYISENPHIHTNYSDGKNSIVELAAEAAMLGTERIGFTDHWDVTGILGRNHEAEPPKVSFENAYQDRRDELERLEDERSENTTPVQVGDGIEIDYDPSNEDIVEEAIEASKFDYYLLSVHCDTDGNHYGHGSDFRGLTPRQEREAVESYRDNSLRAIDFASGKEEVKVLAHPDRIETNQHLSPYVKQSMYDEIISELSGSDTLPEINGRVAARNGKTRFFESLKNSDLDYTVGTDSHRVGLSPRVESDFDLETMRRLSVLEQRAEEIGRAPESILEDLDIATLEIPFPYAYSRERY